MENYSKAVSEMYSQFKQREAHPMEKYVGRFARRYGEKMEVVGYRDNGRADEPLLIVEAPPLRLIETSPFGGWTDLNPDDKVFKECESYLYASIDDLIG